LRWLREFHAEIGCDMLIRRRGELDKEYMAVADNTYHWESKSSLVEVLNAKGLVGKRRGALENLLRWLSAYERRLLTRLGRENYDLVFVNSFANAQLIPLLASYLPGKPIICRAPELGRWLEGQVGVGSVRKAIPHVDRFIAVSDLVFGYLNSGLNIPREKIIKIPGFIRDGQIRMQKSEVRHQLGVADDAFLVCGCGTLDWRKGGDLFIQVAAEIERRYPDREIRFCWIGGSGSLAAHETSIRSGNAEACVVCDNRSEHGCLFDYFIRDDLFA
jgi:glycosyltransferase involved in cell wall biosynthesis